MKHKYNVGEKVRIKSLDWYNENKDKDGFVDFSTSVFVPGMSQFCGKIVTIEDFFEEEDDVIYWMEGINYDWTDEMIEGLVEEETKPKYEDEVNGEYYSTPKYLVRPSGYQFVDENGNVINATKIVLEKKKREYPKTYEECCKVMGVNHTNDLNICEHCDYKTEITYYEDSLLEKIETLYRLYICRDAYWKIAGEEKGLGKPWEPIYQDEKQDKHCIYVDIWGITLRQDNIVQHVFSFPTPEMRDAFYENFKSEIEICKELL